MPNKGNNIYLRKDGCLEGQYLREKTNDRIRCGYTFGKTFEDVESRISEITTCALKFSATSGVSFENLFHCWVHTSKSQSSIVSIISSRWHSIASHIRKSTSVVILSPLPNFATEAELIPAFSFRSLFFIFLSISIFQCLL